MLGFFPPLSEEEKEYADSLSASAGIIDDASGVDSYKSCSSVRPRDTTGFVA
jgi:hypothetical protein